MWAVDGYGNYWMKHSPQAAIRGWRVCRIISCFWQYLDKDRIILIGNITSKRKQQGKWDWRSQFHFGFSDVVFVYENTKRKANIICEEHQ
jgi:hypothetical protein